PTHAQPVAGRWRCLQGMKFDRASAHAEPSRHAPPSFAASATPDALRPRHPRPASRRPCRCHAGDARDVPGTALRAMPAGASLCVEICSHAARPRVQVLLLSAAAVMVGARLAIVAIAGAVLSACTGKLAVLNKPPGMEPPPDHQGMGIRSPERQINE